MIIGLRILALIIDCLICFFSIPLFAMATGWVIEYLGNIGSGFQGLLLMPLWILLIVISPFLYFGVTTGLWGKMPGKFICRLYVVDANDNRPGLWRGLGRETLKIVAIASGLGATIAFLQLYFQGITWYDSICRTQVHFKPYIRSTKTQRIFRKYFKDRQRGL